MLKLSKDNYFSIEANMEYMSASQVKAFMKCEAAALAEAKGEYQREMTVSLLVGSYVDAYFEGTLDKFMTAHPELFKANGELKKEYIKANEIIQRIKRDNLMMEYLSGKSQVIKTGKIDGIPFKIKIDSYHTDKIVDLKCMKDFKAIYVPNKGRCNFIEAWGYDIQGAIYQAIEGNHLPFYIVAATKESVPDIDIFEVTEDYLELALDTVRQNIMRYQAIKQGIIMPERCGKCDYCKKTKVLTEPRSIEELDYYE